MTKANEKANARKKDLERRARRKMARLKRKGVNVGSISPLKNVDNSNTWDVKRYNKELEQFISRKTQYVAGYGGLAIEKSEWRKYKRLEKKWNEAHAKYWRANARDKIMGEDMTLAQKAHITPRKTLFGQIDYQRSLDSRKIVSAKDLQRRMDILVRETAPDYPQQRARKLRSDLIEHMNIYNNSELERELRSMRVNELVYLQNNTLFVENFFTFSYDWTQDQYDAYVEFLINDIQAVKRRFRSKPNKRSKK